jgi:hypothetical protein
MDREGHAYTCILQRRTVNLAKLGLLAQGGFKRRVKGVRANNSININKNLSKTKCILFSYFKGGGAMLMQYYRAKTKPKEVTLCPDRL